MTTYKALKPLLMGEIHLWTKDHWAMHFEKDHWNVLYLTEKSHTIKSYTIEEVNNAEVLTIWNQGDYSFVVYLDLEAEKN